MDTHPDNCGDEKELLHFEMVTRKLASFIKYAEISCSICLNHSVAEINKENM